MHTRSFEEECLASIKPLHIVSRVVGLAPFSLNFQPSKVSSIYTFMLAIVVFYQLILRLFVDKSPFVLHDEARWIVPRFCMLVVSVITALITLKMAVFDAAKRLKQFFVKIVKIDKVLYANTSIYKNVRKYLLIEFCIIGVTLGGTMCCEFWVISKHHFYEIILRHITFAITYILVIKYVNLVLLMKTRYSTLNDKLKELFKPTEPSYEHHGQWLRTDGDLPTHTSKLQTNLPIYSDIRCVESNKMTFVVKISYTNVATKVKSLRRIHNELHQVSDIVNANYGFVMLMEITYLLISLITHLNTTILSLFNNDIERESIMYASWLVVNVAILVGICMSCDFTSYEANKTSLLVQQFLLLESINSEVELELLKFAQQLMSTKLVFTAYGFFTLDCALLLNVVGTATTYIIILLQLKH